MDSVNFTLDKIYAGLPRTERGRAIVLGKDPKGQNFLYTNSKNVIIRDIKHPEESDVYSGHARETSVAKYSPSRFYIASGDASGTIKIWDTVNKEHLLKYEYQVLAGKIKDIDWTEDSKRLVIGGEGRGTYAKGIMWDTGTTIGNVDMCTKHCNGVAIRQKRPYALVTASDDQCAEVYKGPPFQHQKHLTEHSNFVNCVEYAPDGSVFVTGGSDGKVFVYDGVNFDGIGQLGSPAHKGSVYAISFSPDSKKLLTCSGDKTAKIFNLETRELETTFVMGSHLLDMQVGCLWQGDDLITVSLSGHINYLDIENPSQPKRIIRGHNKSITAMALSQGKIYTACSLGRIVCWDTATHENMDYQGAGHGVDQKIQDMTECDGMLVSVSMNDTIMWSRADEPKFGEKATLDSQPRGVSSASGIDVVACINHVLMYRKQHKVLTMEVKYEPQSIAINLEGSLVAVGGAADQSIHLYSVNGDDLNEIKCAKLTGHARDLAFSPDGKFLGAGCSDRHVVLYSMPDLSVVFDGVKHTGRVDCISWSPDSTMMATGSLDTNIAVWSIHKTSYPYHIAFIEGTHRPENPNRVRWLDNETIVSAGHDCHMKFWKMEQCQQMKK